MIHRYPGVGNYISGFPREIANVKRTDGLSTVANFFYVDAEMRKNIVDDIARIPQSFQPFG